MSDVIRIGRTEEPGYPMIVVELFGIPLASSTNKVADFDADPEAFTEVWREYFASRIVAVVAEKLHQDRVIPGWLMATRLSPRVPQLPAEGERP